MLTAVKGRYDFDSHLPSAETVWARQWLLSASPTCVSFLRISCLKSVQFQKNRRVNEVEWPTDSLCLLVVNKELSLLLFSLSCYDSHALCYSFLLPFSFQDQSSQCLKTSTVGEKPSMCTSPLSHSSMQKCSTLCYLQIKLSFQLHLSSLSIVLHPDYLLHLVTLW